MAELRINFQAIRGLLHEPGVAAETARVARNIEARVQTELDTKFDMQFGPKRPRCAVIAGYEHDATAEDTRRVLLSSLDGA